MKILKEIRKDKDGQKERKDKQKEIKGEGVKKEGVEKNKERMQIEKKAGMKTIGSEKIEEIKTVKGKQNKIRKRENIDERERVKECLGDARG